MCHSLHAQTAAAEDSVCILISGQPMSTFWSGLETKQYPLLDVTENARAVPAPPHPVIIAPAQSTSYCA